MTLCRFPISDALVRLGFFQELTKRAGDIGAGRTPAHPVGQWRRRFNALPDTEKTVLAAFMNQLLPEPIGLEKEAFAGALARGVATGTRALRGGARMLDDLSGGVAASVDDLARMPLPVHPPKVIVGPSAVPTPLPLPGAAAGAGAAEAAGAAGAGVKGWLGKSWQAWKNLPRWQQGLIGGLGVVYPTYQMAQGQIGPGQWAGHVAGSLLTLPMGGFLLPAATGYGAALLGENVIDPALGWKPMEQRLQEAYAQGQGSVPLPAPQFVPPMPNVGPGLSPNRLAITSPGGSMLRPDLTMQFQMTQRQNAENLFERPVAG